MPSATDETLTLLFTDLQGSTRMAQDLRADYADVLAAHHDIIRSAAELSDGTELGSEGDALFYAFRTPRSCLKAATEAQLSLHSYRSPADVKLRVRMGIHTCVLSPSENGLIGLGLHQAARICALAHGGQILMSESAALLLDNSTIETSLLHLGTYRLRDLDTPITLFEVQHRELPSAFPPLASQLVGSNLPSQLSTFIGRAAEISQLAELLQAHRLVTVAGPGGVGKTRVALQTAQAIRTSFRDGVHLVSLGPLSSPLFVAQAIAESLRIHEERHYNVAETVVRRLQTHELLIVFDNCEHLVASAADFASFVLTHCPEVRVLATSRRPLGISGEYVFQLSSLTLPADDSSDPQAILSSDAVRLFYDRATLASATTVRSDDNARIVAEICRKVDGLPLAIELAAARTRALPVAEIARRLDHRFDLLSSPSLGGLPHQRTMRATLDWSFELLKPAEQTVLLAVAVFPSRFSIADAEHLAVPAGVEALAVVPALASLVDQSLLTRDTSPTEAPYFLPANVRAYVLDRAVSFREALNLHRIHADYVLQLITTPASPRQALHDWLDLVDHRRDDCRVALQTLADQSLPSEAARLAQAIFPYWLIRGQYDEAKVWLRRILTAPLVEPALQASVLLALGELATFQVEDDARRWLSEALAIGQSIQDDSVCSHALCRLSLLALQDGSLLEAERLAEESRVLARSLGPSARARPLLHLGMIAQDQNRLRDARELYVAAQQLFLLDGETREAASVLMNQGLVSLDEGDPLAARALYEAALQLFDEIGYHLGRAVVLFNLGEAMIHQGQHLQARANLEESLRLAEALGDRRTRTGARFMLASIALDDGNMAEAAPALALSLHKAIDLGDQRFLTEVEEECSRLLSYSHPDAAAMLLTHATLMRSLNRWPQPPMLARRLDETRQRIVLRTGMGLSDSGIDVRKEVVLQEIVALVSAISEEIAQNFADGRGALSVESFR